jgi:hypothetical protein
VGTSDSSSEKADDWIVCRMKYGCAVGKKNGAFNPSTELLSSGVILRQLKLMTQTTMKCVELIMREQDHIFIMQKHHNCFFECIHLGAGFGSGFINTAEL